MSESIVLTKAIKFALRIVALYKYLTEQKKEFVMSKQILLSGSFIAKHVNAALHPTCPIEGRIFERDVHRSAEKPRN